MFCPEGPGNVIYPLPLTDGPAIYAGPGLSLARVVVVAT